MALKLKIIINPSSGRETARLNVEDMIAYLVSFNALERADIYYTSQRFDAERFAADTPADTYDYMIACGGDGTVNEVITGMLRNNIKTPLAIYTSGTVNDFATTNNLPSLPSDFARMLMSPKLIKVDCGKANDSYFLNVLAGGFMSDISYKVPSELKTALGPAAYWVSAMKDIPTIAKTIPLTFTSKDDNAEGEFIAFYISNTKSVGGFRNLMKKALINDGMLDVLALRKMELSDVFPLLGKLMIGDHINNNRVVYFQTDHLEINTTSDKDIVTDIDGEKGPSLPLTIDCIRDAITLVIPNEEEES